MEQLLLKMQERFLLFIARRVGMWLEDAMFLLLLALCAVVWFATMPAGKVWAEAAVGMWAAYLAVGVHLRFAQRGASTDEAVGQALTLPVRVLVWPYLWLRYRVPRLWLLWPSTFVGLLVFAAFQGAFVLWMYTSWGGPNFGLALAVYTLIGGVWWKIEEGDVAEDPTDRLEQVMVLLARAGFWPMVFGFRVRHFVHRWERDFSFVGCY